MPLQLGWNLVVLDTMDMSNHAECPSAADAVEFAAAHPADSHPQMALGRGMANGGIGREQMAWLKHTLASCERERTRVVVAMHHPAVEGVAPLSHLVWNHLEVQKTQKTPAQS